jgi:hypothetical protein
MVILTLIIISLGILPSTLRAGDCSSGDEMFVTAPQSGAKTMQPSITVRGYLCHNRPLIMIRNETTATETITETNEVCDSSQCTYHFAAPVRGLALGENRITAEIPGDGTLVELEVIRTALASSASSSESCAAGSGLAGL